MNSCVAAYYLGGVLIAHIDNGDGSITALPVSEEHPDYEQLDKMAKGATA